MPIDPSIVLGVKPPRFEQDDPISMFGKVLGAKSALAQSDLQQLQMQQARQGIADEQALRSAYQQSGGDRVKLRELLTTGGQYKALRDLDKFEIDQKKAAAAIGKDESAAAKNKYDMLIDGAKRRASMLTLANPDNWPVIRELIAQESPQAAMVMPAQFDEVWVKSNIAKGQTIAERLTDQRAREDAAERRRANRESEATARGQLGVAQGNLKVARDRLTFDQTNPKEVLDPDRGLLVNPRTGNARPVMMGGQPVGMKPKPLTESQGRAQMFGTRAAAADRVLRDLEGKYGTLGLTAKQGLEGLPVVGGAASVAANPLMSENQQQVDQAQRDFINAVLRQESGAVISPQEFENARKQYFPQPGDGKKVIEQKRMNRQKAIDGFTLMSGSAGQRIVDEQGGTPKPKASGNGALTQNPDGTFTYGVPQ